MRSYSLATIALIFILALTLVSARFDLKKRVKHLGDKVDGTAQQVDRATKSAANNAEHLATQIKQDIDDTVVTKVAEIGANMQKELDKLEGDNSLAADIKRKEIMEKAQAQLELQIQQDLRKKTYDKIVKDIFGEEVNPEQLKRIVDNSELPEIIKQYVENLDDYDIDARNWNFPNEAKSQINELYKIEDSELQAEIDSEIEDIINRIAAGESYDEATSGLIELLQDEISDEEELKDFLEELEYTIEDLEDASLDTYEEIQFKVDEFRDEVKETIHEMEDDYDQLEPEEKQYLSDYILMTNESLDQLLRRIADPKIRDRLMKRFRNQVQESLEEGNRDYDNIMEELDGIVGRIEDDQTEHIVDGSIKLRAPYVLPPNQQYTFSIDDVMEKQRSDSDFFEFVSVDMSENRIYSPDGNEEGFIYVTPDLIRGIAFSKEGKYVYNATLKYSSFRNGGKPVMIDTTFTLEVNKNAKGAKSTNEFQKLLLIACIILGLISLALIGYQCYNRISGRKTIKYEDMESRVSASHNGRMSKDSDF